MFRGRRACSPFSWTIFRTPRFHFGGAFGVASGNTKIKGTGDNYDGAGAGLAGWVGWDAWVSSQWSLGGMLRLMGSITRQNRDDVSYEGSIGGVALSFTALYH